MGNTRELTQQQENFLQKYIECGIGYQSYIYAYPKAKNWTRNSVDSQVNKLLNNPKISTRLAEYNKEIESTLKNSITLNKRKILDEIIEAQQNAKNAGNGQAGINLQALKLLAQIAKLLDTSPTINNNILVNNNTMNNINNFLDL